MSAAAQRLWLVRHGETTGESSIRYHGSNDVPLSELGRTQVRALAPLLAGVDFVRVVHSPLSRAAESAAILAERLGLAAAHLVADERLREISFGACEGLTRAEIEPRFPDFWRDYQDHRTDRFPGGEARTEFASRAMTAVSDWLQRHAAGDLLLVAHRGIVRMALCHLLGVPPTGHDPFAVALGSLTVVRRDAAGWQVELLGECGPMAGT